MLGSGVLLQVGYDQATLLKQCDDTVLRWGHPLNHHRGNLLVCDIIISAQNKPRIFGKDRECNKTALGFQ